MKNKERCELHKKIIPTGAAVALHEYQTRLLRSQKRTSQKPKTQLLRRPPAGLLRSRQAYFSKVPQRNFSEVDRPACQNSPSETAQKSTDLLLRDQTCLDPPGNIQMADSQGCRATSAVLPVNPCQIQAKAGWKFTKFSHAIIEKCQLRAPFHIKYDIFENQTHWISDDNFDQGGCQKQEYRCRLSAK